MTVVLNLGSGTRTSGHPHVINVDWSVYLRIRRNPLLRRLALLFLDADRLMKLEQMGDNVVVHDLRQGIPRSDESVDVVYHSHVLEHIDRDRADSFMAEVIRVLRPGGLHRIVVPDLELLARGYLNHLEAVDASVASARDHDDFVAGMIEQSVRREAFGSAQKRPLRRRIENLVLGDARKRGETHQWMYDRVNLRHLLSQAGFVDIERRAYDESRHANWAAYGLDRNDDGSEYKPGSLYVEAVKP